MLKNKVKSLESRVESKTKPIKIDDKEVNEDEVIPIINYKKSGFRREGPQVEAKTQHCNREFKCDTCDYILESQGLLEAHRKVHQPSSSFTCDQCDERFATKGQLEIHMKSEHATDMEFNCDDCSFQGDGEFELRKHINRVLMIS